MLTAALALVALPGFAGSRAPSPIEPLPASAFQSFTSLADGPRSTISIGLLDAAHVSAATIGAGTSIVEPGAAPMIGSSGDRASRNGTPRTTTRGIAKVSAAAARRAARYTLTGGATFYDNGTTAMRIPRGTIVVICGKGGCIKRVVNDYGPQKKSRVVDMYRPDFFAICGCASWAGTTQVTVYVF